MPVLKVKEIEVGTQPQLPQDEAVPHEPARQRCSSAAVQEYVLSGFHLLPFVRNLGRAYGFGYITVTVLQYGVNQGGGYTFVNRASQYFLLDEVKLSTSELGAVLGFSMLPWSIKVLFGIVADAVPIFGSRRTAYLIQATVIGIAGSVLLATADSLSVIASSLLLFMVQYGFAFPDVIVDGTMADKMKVLPALGADLQGLSWGAYAIMGTVLAPVSGVLVEAVGSQPLYWISAGCTATVTCASCIGLLGEHKHWPLTQAGRDERKSELSRYQACAQIWTENDSKWVSITGMGVGILALGLGLANSFLTTVETTTIGVINIAVAALIVAYTYACLRRVSEEIARAVVFVYLYGAVAPSTRVLFAWSHDSSDDRCWSAERCAEAAGYLPDTASYAQAVANFSSYDGIVVDPMPCGWSRALDQPCISPLVFSLVDGVGGAALLFGTWLYTAWFQKVSFRLIIGISTVAHIIVNFWDLFWTTRTNRSIGFPDELFVFGDEIISAVIERLLTMPLLIFAAALCPPKFEATTFALIMGFANFGSSTGLYIGSFLLDGIGVQPPKYDRLSEFVAIRSACRVIPLFLLWLIPQGSPATVKKGMAQTPVGERTAKQISLTSERVLQVSNPADLVTSERSYSVGVRG